MTPYFRLLVSLCLAASLSTAESLRCESAFSPSQPLSPERRIDDYTPDFDANGETILFSSTRAGDSPQLFKVGVESQTIEQVTHGPGINHYGSFSPDGSRIAFVSSRSGENAIWIANADGSEAWQLTEGGYGHNERPDWSPDGRHLAFDWGRSGQRRIWIADLATREMTQITPNESPSEDTYPSWSPDGRQLVFMSRGRVPGVDLWVVDVPSGEIRQLTRMPEIVWAPHWSDDGRKIAFWAGETWDFQIYTIDPKGGEPTQLTNAWEWNWSPRWSRNGEWITFGSSRTGRRGVYIMRADGSETRQLTNLEPSDFARSVLEEGASRALTRLAASRQGDPDATFTNGTEVRYLVRRLMEHDQLDSARRLAEWNLLERPRSSDAADLWIQVRRAQGETTPPMARELVALYRRGQYDAVQRLEEATRREYPGWRLYSSFWLRLLVDELELLRRDDDLARLADEAVRLYPEQVDFREALAGALMRLGRVEESREEARRILELDPENETALRILSGS